MNLCWGHLNSIFNIQLRVVYSLLWPIKDVENNCYFIVIEMTSIYCHS